MSEQQEPVNDELADEAAELIQETKEQHEQNRKEQQEFLDTVAEEEGAEVLETKCDIHGHTVDVSAKLNGALMDAMGRVDDRLERIDNQEARAYEISATAEEVSDMLETVTEDKQLHKDAFYREYEKHGIEVLGVILQEVFESLKKEKKRRQGAADGFRKTE